MEFFTEQNKPLLEEAAAVDFQFTKTGSINSARHTKHELGLYFIKRAVEIHGNKYGYSKVTYVNNSTKVIIVCSKHWDFEQTPHRHLEGKGCPHCGGTAKLSKHTFIARSQEVHGHKYNYDTSIYTSMRYKLEIICSEHGSFFQLPLNHLKGQGCAKCAGTSPPTTEEFIEKARNVHGDKYDYSSVQYKSSYEKIEIICYLHGSFFQTPDSHINQGNGCPKCAGKNHNMLYLLKCLDTGWYKIGITTDKVQKRIVSIGGNIEEVHHVVLDEPRKHETILHKKYEKYREYNLCVRNGNTEFFSLTEEHVKEVIDYMNEAANNA